MFLSNDLGYLIIGIIILILLIALYIISYILNKKTPVPKGCENIKIDEETCKSCNNAMCKIKEKITSNEEEE